MREIGWIQTESRQKQNVEKKFLKKKEEKEK